MMSLIDFVKDAGEKLFGVGKAKAATQDAAADPNNAAKAKAANDAQAMRSSPISRRKTCRRQD
jgi:hypothetical protein